MRSDQNFFGKAPRPDISAPAAERMAAAFSRAIGLAISRAAKGLLTLASHGVRSDTARLAWRRDTGLLATRDRETAQGADQWIWPKKPLVLPMARQSVMSCDVGTVWITQGDGNDYVLKAGEKLTLHPFDNVIVTAVAGPAVVRHTL